jgi:hypothetical protein
MYTTVQTLVALSKRSILFAFTLGGCAGEPAPHAPDNTTSKMPSPQPSNLVQLPRDAELALASSEGLDADQIRSVVMSHIGAVRACYDAHAEHNPGTTLVVMAWEIDPSGSVSSVSVNSTTPANPLMEACLMAEVRQWKFAATGIPTTVGRFPFDFGGGEQAPTAPADTYVGTVTLRLATEGARVSLVCNNCRPVQRKMIRRFPVRMTFPKPDEQSITIRLRPKTHAAQ